jgi:DNA-binding beta-propeller fold protein YncE
MKISAATLFFASALLLSGSAGAQPPQMASGRRSPSPLVLKATIPLPGAKGRMDHMSVDLKGRRVFVSEIGNGGVEAVDIASDKPIHLLTGFGEPQGNYYMPATNRLFVASGDDGTVKIFDGATYKLVATAKFTIDADDLRYDPRTQHVIVGYSGQKFVGGKPIEGPGGEGDGALGWVDSQGHKGTLVPVDAHPEAFELEKQGTRVFINVPDHHEIEVGDLATGKILARWPVSCTDNFPMAFDEADHRLFIGCRIPPKMLVFDTETGKSIAAVDIAGTADDMFYDAARHRIYVLGGQGYVDVIAEKDPNHYALVARVRSTVGSRTGLFVPELNELFVAITQSAHQLPELLVYKVQ